MPAYSFSKIQTYLKCPLSYKYRYIDDIIPPKEDSLELILGNTVHSTLEYLYNQINIFKIPLLDELLNNFEESFQKQIENKNFLPEDIDTFKTRGINYITNYYNKYKPFNKTKILSTEEKINFKLSNGASFTGKIDRLDKLDNTIIIVDYKTNKTLPTDDNQMYDEQIILYSYGILQKYGKQFKNIKGKIEFLHFEHTKEIEITEDTINQVINKYLNTINEIEEETKELKNGNEEAFQTKESGLCKFCPFQEICPLFSHYFGSVYDDELSEDTIKMLIDEYVEINNKKKELEKQLEGTKEILKSYAKRNNLKRLYGNKYKISVSQRLEYKIKDKENLAKILKELNIIEKALKLDKYKLTRLIKNKEIDLNKIIEYLEESEIISLRGSEI